MWAQVLVLTAPFPIQLPVGGWESSGGWPKCLGTCFYKGDPEETPWLSVNQPFKWKEIKIYWCSQRFKCKYLKILIVYVFKFIFFNFISLYKGNRFHEFHRYSPQKNTFPSLSAMYGGRGYGTGLLMRQAGTALIWGSENCSDIQYYRLWENSDRGLRAREEEIRWPMELYHKMIIVIIINKNNKWNK